MRERIRQLMESLQMTQQTFAEHIGISPASMSSIFNGRTNPTINTVEAIKRRFPTISTDWLVFGVEPMYVDAQPTAADATQNAGADGTEPQLPFEQEGQHEPHLQGGLIIKKQPTTDNSGIIMREVQAPTRPARTITEIRVFFDDQTYESFVPRK